MFPAFGPPPWLRAVVIAIMVAAIALLLFLYLVLIAATIELLGPWLSAPMHIAVGWWSGRHLRRVLRGKDI